MQHPHMQRQASLYVPGYMTIKQIKQNMQPFMRPDVVAEVIMDKRQARLDKQQVIYEQESRNCN